MIKAIKWEIPWSESAILDGHLTFNSWDEINKAIRCLIHYPEHNYCKSKYKITYEDGHVEEGRFEIQVKANKCDVGAYLKYIYSTQTKPESINYEDYEKRCVKVGIKPDFLRNYEVETYEPIFEKVNVGYTKEFFDKKTQRKRRKFTTKTFKIDAKFLVNLEIRLPILIESAKNEISLLEAEIDTFIELRNYKEVEILSHKLQILDAYLGEILYMSPVNKKYILYKLTVTAYKRYLEKRSLTEADKMFLQNLGWTYPLTQEKLAN